MTKPYDTGHLRDHRKLILSRSLLAGCAGMVPVPYVDDLLAGAVRSALVRRLAESRHVDLDANAAAALATPRASHLIGAASLGAIALGATRRTFRRVAASLLFVRRADEALQTFQVATLFDHYCARHHVGFGLTAERAFHLRRSMDAAIRTARSEALARAFRGGVRTLGGWARRVPNAWSLLTRRRRTGDRLAAAPPVASLEARLSVAEENRMVRRAVEAVEAEVVAVEQSYLGALLGAFDRAWEPHKEHG